MFRIEFVVEGMKNLPKVLHALNGLVLNMKPPVPVGNATVKKGKLIQQESDTSLKGLVLSQLGSYKEPAITVAELKEMVRKAGGNESSYSYVIAQLRNEKVLKLKKRGLWQVL